MTNNTSTTTDESSDELCSDCGRARSEHDIEPRGRQLTWYSLRRGAATMWASEASLGKAASQLRHKKLETTRRYRVAKAKDRTDMADELW